MGDCISVIPLDYRVRKAFANDELVIKIYPMSPFSQEISRELTPSAGSPWDNGPERL